jgi:hypothetical protein
MNDSKIDESLSRTLADWRVTPRRDPQFRTAVWARIEAARRALTWTGYLRRHAPAMAAALAVAVVLGAWIGREQARARVEADRNEIASAYVQALDARTMRP